jgi:ERCC4-type nuclease
MSYWNSEESKLPQISIIVDNREQKVIPIINEIKQKYHTPVFIDRLEAGDYAIVYRSIVIAIIERKTWRDLSASIKDGRIRNIDKLINAREKTKCKVLFILEGRAFPALDRCIGRITYKVLREALDHTRNNDINVIFTPSKNETVHRLFQLVDNYCSFKPSIFKPIDNKLDVNVDVLKEKYDNSTKYLQYRLWESLPNITSKTSSVMIDNDICIKKFLLEQIPKDDLSVLRYPNGKIIGKDVDKVCSIHNHKLKKKYYRKLVGCFKGIGVKKAKELVSQYTIKELFEQDFWQIQELE